MPHRWDSPGKQGFAGPPLRLPFPQPFPPLYSGLPAVRTQPQNSRLCSPLPSAPPTHSVGFSLPHSAKGLLQTQSADSLPLAQCPQHCLSALSPCPATLPLQDRRPPFFPTPTAPSPYIPHLNSCCARATGLESVFPTSPRQPPATVPSPTTPFPMTPQSQSRRCSGLRSPGWGAQAAGEVRDAQRRPGLGAGGRARASLGRGALPRGPFCARRWLPSLFLQRRPPGIPRRAPPLALRSAPFHLDFCRRGNFGFGDDLRSYWLPAGGVGGHGCSRYSAPRGAAQRLVSSQQVPSASPGVTCAPGGPCSLLLMQIDRGEGRGEGR